MPKGKPPAKPFKKGQVQPGGGRPKGSPNRIRKGWKESIEELLELRGPDLDAWVARIAKKNPYAAIDALNKLADFTHPKLQRRELSGDPNGNPIVIKTIVDDIT